MRSSTSTCLTSGKTLAAVMILGLVSTSAASAQRDVVSRNVISNSGNGQGNTIITSNHTAGSVRKAGGKTRVTASNAIRNSGNGRGNKILAHNRTSVSAGRASGDTRVRTSNTIQDSGNGQGNLVIGSNHATVDGSQLGPGDSISYRNVIRKRGNGSGNMVIASDEITFERPQAKQNPGQDAVRTDFVPKALPGQMSAPQIATYTEKSREISTRIGRLFVVELASNPSTGARWDVGYDRRKLLVVDRQYNGAKAGSRIGPDTERYTFVSISLGNGSIELHYGKGGQKPLRSLVMQVQVHPS